MALFQCVIATFVAAGAAVQPEAPVRRHRDALPQAAADCTTDKKFSGKATWKGRCYTLDKCRNECKAAAGCEAFNWWPAKGGCRHHGAGYTEGGATPWDTIGGKSDCILDVTGPTDCVTCPSSCTKPAPTPAPAPVNVPATTWCGKGITNPLSKSNICCAASCLNEAGTPECGGSGCGSREGGKNKCCHNFITRECENFDDVACVKPTAAYHSLENSNGECDKDHESRHIGHIKTIQCDDNGGRTIPQCAEECKNTLTCKGFGYGNAGGEHCSGDKGKCHMFSVKYCDTNPTWKWHALGQATATEITISSIKASSASCDGCTSGTGCDPRGPNRLISPCNSTLCQTTWGCGGSCTADTLTVNGNGQGEWCSRGGSASSTGGQWLDLDLGSSYSVTKFEIWSGASGNRFPQSMQILTGGSINDGSTGGGNGCFDKSSSIAAATGGWSAVAGPFVTGQGTSLTGCANARNRAGVNTQTDSDKCEVPVSGVTGQYIRIWFEGTAGNDNYMELRAIKVFGTQA